VSRICCWCTAVLAIVACSSPSDGGGKPTPPTLAAVNSYTFVDSAYNLYRALPGWDSVAWPLRFYLYCPPNPSPQPTPATCNGAQLSGHVVNAQAGGQVGLMAQFADPTYSHFVDFWLWMFPDIRRDWALHLSCMAGTFPNGGPFAHRWIVLRAQLQLTLSRVDVSTQNLVADSLRLLAFSDTVRIDHNGSWSDTTDRGSDVDNLLSLMSQGVLMVSQANDSTRLGWGIPNGGPYVSFNAPVSNWQPLQFHATGHVLVANTLCGGYSDTGDTNFVDLRPL